MVTSTVPCPECNGKGGWLGGRGNWVPCQDCEGTGEMVVEDDDFSEDEFDEDEENVLDSPLE